MTDSLRGHPIHHNGKKWVYSDTLEPTAHNRRDCATCELPDTSEGHDPCLGTIPNAMNACCGHGDDSEAYVQYRDKVA